MGDPATRVSRDIVVVGASAGGVEALRELVAALPPDLDAAVFVVLHVPMTGTSVLPSILGRVTALRVDHAVDGDPIERGRIYIAPPDQHLLVGERVELLRSARENGHRPAIDPLFRSAAAAYGHRVIGVVLSGTLDDGADGLRLIRRSGGAALVQDPEEALYGAMPRAAIAYARPNAVLPVGELAERIARLTHEHAIEEVAMADAEEPIDATVAVTQQSHEDPRPGVRSAYACPDCGGGLWEVEAAGRLRFRCRVAMRSRRPACSTARRMRWRTRSGRACASSRNALRSAVGSRPGSSSGAAPRRQRAFGTRPRTLRMRQSSCGRCSTTAACCGRPTRSPRRRPPRSAASLSHDGRAPRRGFRIRGAARVHPRAPRLRLHGLQAPEPHAPLREAHAGAAHRERCRVPGVPGGEPARVHRPLQHDPHQRHGVLPRSAAWDYLQSEIIPRIVDSKGPGESIRVWSTGCASGEEAYSIAIAFAEELGDDVFKSRVKIYATDVDEQALGEGRHARYPSTRLDDVAPELVERYFERQDQHFVFRADLRRCVIFGRHDLVLDPPISRIDLLASRNTLMYFTADAQSRILTNFHFALRPSGYLFLGKSEVLLSRRNLFTPVDVKRRVFQKLGGEHIRDRMATPETVRAHEAAAVDTSVSIRDATFEVSPVAQVVVDQDGNLALANHHARALFNLAPHELGRPLKDLELSYRPLELRSLIDRVYEDRHAVGQRNVEWRATPGETLMLDVNVAPLVSARGDIVGVNISFADVTKHVALQSEVEASKWSLETAYEELQSTVEELETTNEELHSTNEELETTNEELQSTNEELETMNEELQSTNEELSAINDELNQRSDELNSVNAFLESVLASLEGGVIVVNPELRVTAWNNGARELWGLTADEVVGQHLLNLDIGVAVDKLRNPLRDAMMDGGRPTEIVLDAVNRRGRAFTCKVVCTPLRNDTRPNGAILFMEDESPA